MRLHSLVIAVFLALLCLGCEEDPDDPPPTIPPPAGCDSPSLSNVTFTYTIHFDGEDYPQAELVTLLQELGVEVFSFPFAPAIVTELGPDPDSNRQAITLTDNTPPPEGEDPPEDPNWVRIVYELPLGYELPVELGQAIGSITALDMSGDSLIAAFGLWEEREDGEFDLAFLAEPSDTGMFWEPGPFHPVFKAVELRDRACPNLNRLTCASTYNLSTQFEVNPDLVEEGEEEVPGDAFELWPTEHQDFTYNGIELRAVNVWSFTHREIDPECSSSYDFAAKRSSFFVTRTAAAPSS